MRARGRVVVRTPVDGTGTPPVSHLARHAKLRKTGLTELAARTLRCVGVNDPVHAALQEITVYVVRRLRMTTAAVDGVEGSGQEALGVPVGAKPVAAGPANPDAPTRRAPHLVPSRTDVRGSVRHETFADDRPRRLGARRRLATRFALAGTAVRIVVVGIRRVFPAPAEKAPAR